MVILNVDDDLDDRDMFRQALMAIDSNISCVLIESVEEALEWIEHADVLPDYIFLDINMPRMNGYECVDAIHSMTGTDGIQIVMYSTTFNPKRQEELERLGIRHLLKTSRVADLQQSIKDLICV